MSSGLGGLLRTSRSLKIGSSSKLQKNIEFNSKSISTSTRIVASALVSRSPIILPPLTPLESTYYSYQRSIHRALSKPLQTSTDWFLKSGSTTEKSFLEFDKEYIKELGVEGEEAELFEAQLGVEVNGDREGEVDVQTRADLEGDERSLERKLARTLYLLVKKDRTSNQWQFPQGGVEGDETLVQAALRELKEEVGENVDIWNVGKVPAGHYHYQFPIDYKKSNHTSASVFFLPMRIIRGQAVPNKTEGLIDHAWLTKEEIESKVGKDYFRAVEGMLSDI